MDDELRKALATFSAQVSGVASDVASTQSLGKQTLTEVRQLGGRVEKLERHVFGSDPPPHPSSSSSVVKRITSNEGDVADLAGRLLNVAASITEVKAELAEQSRELALQSKQAGIGLRGLKWLASKDGRTSMVRVATLIGTCYAALHASGAIR